MLYLSTIKHEYTVIRVSGNLTLFAEEVEEKLKEGWKLVGGVAYDGVSFVQALHKEREVEVDRS